MDLGSELRAYRKHLGNAKRIVIKEIRALVDPHLVPWAGYCGLVCNFFPPHPKTDYSHERERKVRGGVGVTGIMGFTADGVIDDICVGLSTIDYEQIDIGDLVRLRKLARKFDAIHRVKGAKS